MTNEIVTPLARVGKPDVTQRLHDVLAELEALASGDALERQTAKRDYILALKASIGLSLTVSMLEAFIPPAEGETPTQHRKRVSGIAKNAVLLGLSHVPGWVTCEDIVSAFSEQPIVRGGLL